MAIVEKTPTTLVIQSRPLLESLVGVLFVGGGTWAALGGEPVFGAGFIIAGAVIIFGFATTVTSRFDRTTGRFTRVTKGLVRRSEIDKPLTDITAVRVDARGGSANSPSQSHTVVLVLKSRERIDVASGATSGKTDKERLAAEIREFLALPEPTQDPPGFGEMVRALVDAAKGRPANGE